MNMHDFSEENRKRCEHPKGFNHKLESWSLSDWMTATLGELGEAANVLKKLNRVRDGITGNKETEAELRASFALELADAFIYLDLMSQAAGIDLAKAVRDAFFKKSIQIGYELWDLTNEVARSWLEKNRPEELKLQLEREAKEPS